MSGLNNNDANDTEEILEPNARNIMLSIIGQLSKGSDLHRVSLPTFVLEPRSFLERITDFMSHPEILLGAHKLPTAEERMVAITKYYFSGWHIRPKGVRKPYNPVLGEYFRCKWNFENGTEAYYISEQISHHPPISAYVFASPENKFIIQGEMRPKSKFYGTSAATHLEGAASIKFLDHPDEEYILTYPSIYVYGILFGKLTYDLGDAATISCDKTDLTCRAEFKTKGIFSGSYNTISGKIKRTSNGESLYDFSGKWSEKIYVKGKSSPETVFFDPSTANVHPKNVVSEDAQDPFESRRLWKNVTENLKAKNIEAATEEKNIIEQNQRDETRAREEAGRKYSHRFFDVTESGSTWKLKNLSDDPLKAKDEIENFIFKYDPTATI